MSYWIDFTVLDRAPEGPRTLEQVKAALESAFWSEEADKTGDRLPGYLDSVTETGTPRLFRARVYRELGDDNEVLHDNLESYRRQKFANALAALFANELLGSDRAVAAALEPVRESVRALEPAPDKKDLLARFKAARRDWTKARRKFREKKRREADLLGFAREQGRRGIPAERGWPPKLVTAHREAAAGALRSGLREVQRALEDTSLVKDEEGNPNPGDESERDARFLLTLESFSEFAARLLPTSEGPRARAKEHLSRVKAK